MMRVAKIPFILRNVSVEAWIWIAALLFLGCLNPSGDPHFSVCLFKNLGIGFCPGCGIGHSISYLLHGELQQSIHTHPLGIIALPILMHRIAVLFRSAFTSPCLLTH
jgi:hypothetical protein